MDVPALSRYIGANHLLHALAKFVGVIALLLETLHWYACSTLTGDVCRDGVMRRGPPSVRFAFRLFLAAAACSSYVSC